MKSYEKWFIGAAAAIVITLSVFAFIHWEIENAKKQMVEKAKQKAKQIELTSEKTSKTAGRFLFEVKNFKGKIHDEEKRLQDSAETNKK